MRVMVVVPGALGYGGTTRFLERLLEIHARQGIVTTLLMPEQASAATAALSGHSGVEILFAPDRTGPETAPFLTPFFDLLFSWRAIWSRRPDLIVVSTSDPGRMSIALYLPFPVLYFLHGAPERPFRLLPRIYMRIGSFLNNRVVTVSRAAAQSIAATMGLPADHISVVYNSTPAVQLGPEGGAPVVVTAGHLVPYKNPFGWLEVAKNVLQKRGDATFVWLGDGELLAAMREMVNSAGLQERILLPGYVPDLLPWLTAAQVYFQPSLRESHGIAVLEAMAHRLPCVVADTGGLPESVVDDETGFVCRPGDLAGFTDRILDLLDDRPLRVRLGSAGRLSVEGKFSPAQQEQKLLALYGSLVRKADLR